MALSIVEVLERFGEIDEDVEEALWWTASGRGDVDTTCAIVGGIVALSCGELPAEWVQRREPLPQRR